MLRLIIQKIKAKSYKYPTVGKINFGDLRRVTPFSDWGFGRGTPVDRYYIEHFLESQKQYIKGGVLEIQDNIYTLRFGGKNVTHSHVLDGNSANPKATIISDLTDAKNIPDNSFDSIILTQTLLFIYDLHTAIRTVHRILKPGGVVLVTVPGISKIDVSEAEKWGDYWRFTHFSMAKLFAETFGGNNIEVKTYGNVLSAISFLMGIAWEELTKKELDYHDSDYQVIITVWAVKNVHI